jgi:hypothetical protein
MGTVINRSSKVLWVVETDTGRAIAHKLFPNKRSPRRVDADGVRAADQSPISGHGSWWKVLDISTAEIENGSDGTILDCLTCRKVNDNEFGDIQYDQSDNWGESISRTFESSMNLTDFLSRKQTLADSIIIFAYAFQEGNDYIIDPSPFENSPVYKISEKYVSVNLENPAQIQTNYDKEPFPIYKIAIEKNCPSVIKIETIDTTELIERAQAINRAGIKTFAVTEESERWLTQQTKAENALKFWNAFFRLRGGADSTLELSPSQINQLLTIIRAVSWVESRHGTGTGNEPAKDPMQVGNPNDMGWKQFTGRTDKTDRFVTGPGGGNYDADELPEAVEGLPTFPREAKFSYLEDLGKGHKDRLYNPLTSYYWGTAFLIHKINTEESLGSARRTFRCGDCSRDRLVKGAIAYNGSGVADYGERIKKAIDLIGWPG